MGDLDRTQAVGDDDRGAPLHQPIQRLLHKLFRFTVQRAGGFVEQENARVFEDGARDRQPLPLTTAQFDTPFPDDGVIAIGRLHNKGVSIGRLSGGDDFGFAGL